MTWCDRPDCPHTAKHRLEQLTRPRWRRLLHLPPKVWHVCDLHMFEPISRNRHWTRRG